MNPDGVVCGNYRSSVAGVDLNRQWILPSRELHPEVYYTKAMMHQITNVERKKILIYCDIHCHSKKKNSFLYGCNLAAEGAPFSTWTQVRLLPRLLAKRSVYIRLSSCRFGIDADKVGTARVVVWKEFSVMNSFTLENSFYGYEYGPETKVYSQSDYLEIGLNFLQTLNDYRLCLEQIRQEMIESKGWLKPIKLREITGTPAAEVIEKELRLERINKKKQDFIKKYKIRFALSNSSSKGISIGPSQFSDSRGQLIMANKRLTAKEITADCFLSPKIKAFIPEVKNEMFNTASNNKDLINNVKSEQAKEDDYSEYVISPDQHLAIKDQTSYVSKNSDLSNSQTESAKHSKKNSRRFQIKRQILIPNKHKESNSIITHIIDKQVATFGQSREAMLVSENNSYVRNHTQEELQPPPLDNQSDEVYQNKPTSIFDYKDQECKIQFVDNGENLKDWRQLFNEEELKIAYEKSIGAFNREILALKETKAEHELVVKDITLNDTTLNDSSVKESAKVPAIVQDDFQSRPNNILIKSEHDDSASSASNDNLQETDLYSKVYMRKKDSMEFQIKKTKIAQKNFILKVKHQHKKSSVNSGVDFLLQQAIGKKMYMKKRSQRMEETKSSKMRNYQIKLLNKAKKEPHLLLTGVAIENLYPKTPLYQKQLSQKNCSEINKHNSASKIDELASRQLQKAYANVPEHEITSRTKNEKIKVQLKNLGKIKQHSLPILQKKILKTKVTSFVPKTNRLQLQPEFVQISSQDKLKETNHNKKTSFQSELKYSGYDDAALIFNCNQKCKRKLQFNNSDLVQNSDNSSDIASFQYSIHGEKDQSLRMIPMNSRDLQCIHHFSSKTLGESQEPQSVSINHLKSKLSNQMCLIDSSQLESCQVNQIKKPVQSNRNNSFFHKGVEFNLISSKSQLDAANISYSGQVKQIQKDLIDQKASLMSAPEHRPARQIVASVKNSTQETLNSSLVKSFRYQKSFPNRKYTKIIGQRSQRTIEASTKTPRDIKLKKELSQFVTRKSEYQSDVDQLKQQTKSMDSSLYKKVPAKAIANAVKQKKALQMPIIELEHGLICSKVKKPINQKVVLRKLSGIDISQDARAKANQNDAIDIKFCDQDQFPNSSEKKPRLSEQNGLSKNRCLEKMNAITRSNYLQKVRLFKEEQANIQNQQSLRKGQINEDVTAYQAPSLRKLSHVKNLKLMLRKHTQAPAEIHKNMTHRGHHQTLPTMQSTITKLQQPRSNQNHKTESDSDQIQQLIPCLSSNLSQDSCHGFYDSAGERPSRRKSGHKPDARNHFREFHL